MSAVMDPKGPKYVGYYGGVGSGKSLVLCITMLMQAVIHGGEYAICRAYMPELTRTTYKNFLEICPKELILEHKVAKAELHLKSATGKPAIIYFLGLDEPDKHRSMNLSGFALDEASQCSEEAFLLLMNRMRNPLGMRKGLVVGNPAGHDWVYHRFVKQDMFTTEAAKKSYLMIKAPSTENVHLPDGYVADMLQNYSEERIQREVMGSFDAFEGMVYPEFNRSVHVVRPFKIPDSWTKVIGIDHGYRNPSAWVWGAVDQDSNIYIYREFYEKEWLIEEVCKGNKQKNLPGVLQMMKNERIEQARIDPSTKAARNERDGRKISDFDIYQENLPSDFPLFTANNDVTAGIDRIKTLLKPHPVTGKPRIYVFSTCSNVIEEMTKYRYRELNASQSGKQNEKEEPYKHDDHAMDALRYLVMSQPEPSSSAEDIWKKIKYASPEGQLYRELQSLKAPKIPVDPFE